MKLIFWSVCINIKLNGEALCNAVNPEVMVVLGALRWGTVLLSKAVTILFLLDAHLLFRLQMTFLSLLLKIRQCGMLWEGPFVGSVVP